jgi:RNA polymerase sigma-70 factor (ECF subfamily)
VEDAEDCVQEALIRAAYATNLDPTRIGPFLTTVLVNLCADHGRARSAARRMLTRITYAGKESSPEELICDWSEARWLRSHIDVLLSERERDVLWARVEGLSTREAAHRLNITTKAAEAAFTRARTRMRNLGAS